MNRGEERNQIAHQIAWEYTKHYDPLLSKECWCEIAVRDAIDWADEHPRKGLVDIDKVCKWFEENLHMYNTSECEGDRIDFVEDFKKAMEE